MAQPRAKLTRLFWEDIREQVALHNPNFSKIVDAIEPDETLPLYKASYPYGSEITQHTIVNLPTADGEIIPIDDPKHNTQVRDELTGDDAGLLPFSMVLNGVTEIYTQFGDRLLPWSLVKPGDMMALWRKLEAKPYQHPTHIFSITSGARSIFMVPNISDSGAHSRLKRDFGIQVPPPASLSDHWEIFKTITDHPSVECDWQCEVLLFSRKWLEKILNDSKWIHLKAYLLEYAWLSSSFNRNQLFYNYAFSKALSSRHYKSDPYINDTAKHILAICTGAKPGFSVTQNNELAPIDIIQDVYIHHYGLKKYIPNIMGPRTFDLADGLPVYYSLQHPTTYEFSPKSRKVASTLHNLSELKCLLDVFSHTLNLGVLNVEDTVISRLANDIQLDYFHNKPDAQGEIHLTQSLPELDSNLSKFPSEPEREFAESSTFFRGCVRIMGKVDDD